MKQKNIINVFLAMLAALIMTGHAVAKETVTPICIGCHQGDGKTIWGTLVPGSQKDDSFKVQAGKDIWTVRYDRNSKLKKMATVRDLADEKAVKVRFRAEGDGPVYAEEMSYKSNYGFKDPADVITTSEVVELLKKSPKEGNYVIFDARGYDNYIEGHLPKAVLLPHYQFQAFKDRMPTDKNTLIVAYCRGYG
jgi:hypothetical protein